MIDEEIVAGSRELHIDPINIKRVCCHSIPPLNERLFA